MNNVLTKREYMFVLHVNKQVSSGNTNTDVSNVSNQEVSHIVALSVRSLISLSNPNLHCRFCSVCKQKVS